MSQKPYKPLTTEQIDHDDYPDGVSAAAYLHGLEEQARRANRLSEAVMRVDALLIGKSGFEYLRDSLAAYLGET